MTELQLVVPLRKRLVAATAVVLGEAIGAVGLALVCAGVYLLWGTGWTLIAAGAPLLGAYVWREVRALKAGGRG